MEINVNKTLFASMTLVNVAEDLATYNVCISTPPHILSEGLWRRHAERGPLKSSFPVFLLQFIVIYAITRVLYFPVKKLGLPVLISQMMAGLILGPSIPILEEYTMMLFPYGSQDTLASITIFGYVLFLFETGVKMDLSLVTRAGTKGWAIALLGLITPLLIGLVQQNQHSQFLSGAFEGKVEQARIVLIVHNTTSFAVIASVLTDLQLLNSELGKLALFCALVGDLSMNMIVTVSLIFASEHDMLTVVVRLGSLFVLVVFFFFVYRPAMFWVIEHTPDGREVKDTYINIIIGFLFFMGWFSSHLERGSIILPFLFGLATPDGPPLGSTLITRIHLLGTKLLFPIFMTTCAMRVDARFLKPSSWAFQLVLFVVLMCYLTKMVACLLSSLLFNMPLKDGLSLALLLNCKGVTEVTMYATALDRTDIHPSTYSVILTSMMVLSSISHVLVKHLYDPSRKYASYQKRNIFSLKPNSDLKILVCIHKQHHMTPITRVLDLCYPTAEDPVTVDALHLIQLVGRSSPIFISHKNKDVVAPNLQDSYSDNVILALKLFEDDKQGAALVNPYTAISPPNLMHEDVCNLALDKVASIIILPFHRRWSTDGNNIEYDDKNIRSLNCTVLERAPCSVGILVSRATHQKDDSSLRLALIFLGGNDDREALCLANQAARDPTIKLVIYHIVSKNESENENLETLLDIAMLKEAKQAHSRVGNVRYKEIQVEGGAQTVNILRQMADEHDFIVVGRRHGINSPQTTGLQEWSEFPELGLIGDFFASSDLDCRASILVVQQQQPSH